MNTGEVTVQDSDDPWGADTADRWVMVRADLLTSGLWHADGCSDTAEGLPAIPVALVARLAAWAAHHDDLDAANTSFPQPFYWEQRPDAPVEAFNAEGRAIARALKEALPPDWTVVYEDVDAWLRWEDLPVKARRLILGPDAPHDDPA